MPRRARRRRPPLGQHFLFDPAILRRIVDALDLRPTDCVIEIGAGKGTLTRALLARGARVIAIEKDRRLAAMLRDTGYGIRDTVASGGVEVIDGDALELPWVDLIRSRSYPVSRIPSPVYKVVGNIPYAITSPLIEQALTPPLPERVVFLVQREVAERLAATPGTKAYGALTVGVQAVARVEQLFTVKAGSFAPPPRVHSAVVRLTPLATPLVSPERLPTLRRFVVACFGRRRKQLRNAAAAAWGVDPATAAARLERLGLDPRQRPESLSPAEFVRLFDLSA